MPSASMSSPTLPPESTITTVLPGDVEPAGKKRRQADRAARLHHQPQLVEGEADGDERLRVARDEAAGEPRPVHLEADRAGSGTSSASEIEPASLAFRSGFPLCSERA